jgi:hypothetical protein
MKIVGVDKMSLAELDQAVAQGGRFVFYQYCISVFVMSFKRSSSIHFVPVGQSSTKKGLPFTALSLLVGWWGIPWGPIWTIATVFKNTRGGVDVTAEVLASLKPAATLRSAT